MKRHRGRMIYPQIPIKGIPGPVFREGGVTIIQYIYFHTDFQKNTNRIGKNQLPNKILI